MAVYGLASIPVLTFLAVMPFVGQPSPTTCGCTWSAWTRAVGTWGSQRPTAGSCWRRCGLVPSTIGPRATSATRTTRETTSERTRRLRGPRGRDAARQRAQRRDVHRAVRAAQPPATTTCGPGGCCGATTAASSSASALSTAAATPTLTSSTTGDAQGRTGRGFTAAADAVALPVRWWRRRSRCGDSTFPVSPSPGVVLCVPTPQHPTQTAGMRE